ncbi:MAG: PTS glucitol/sorbitol transporter subunit IIB [Ardenticatenaceae bacterium]|nr:PTS glucitol/sorbitol transporter subunit IIB [Anaerolineales bacterium]MCB8940957.1 PTS glucitol/sorbitol transporter subunit IIB [Ardenticatenaceae bacterium]MCB8972296.1 PTS glucitol/sorbitol transporter subunit IIB [Ardenticatenaceae bacterium]
MQGINKFLERIGRSVGGVVGALYQAGREAIDQVIVNILPFMAFIALVIGIILKTGIGDWIANLLAPMAGSLVGLIIISLICAIPVLSPLLGPGAVIAQVVGTLLGSTLIANGSIPPSYALPALFAINPQVGCDFIPVGLALGEAEPETVEIGVPAILFSRLITGPVAVILAFIASIGLYA